MSADANSMLAQPTTSQNKGEAPKTQAAKEAATGAQQAAAGAAQVNNPTFSKPSDVTLPNPYVNITSTDPAFSGAATDPNGLNSFRLPGT